MIPNTVAAETAATDRAMLLFLSFLFSSFSLLTKFVTLTFPLCRFSSGVICSLNFTSELIIKLIRPHVKFI